MHIEITINLKEVLDTFAHLTLTIAKQKQWREAEEAQYDQSIEANA